MYPGVNDVSFKSLRNLANNLDIISVGELCAMLLFLEDKPNIDFFNDFLDKVRSTDIDDDSFVENKASKFIQPHINPNNFICKMNQTQISRFFATFRVALYELIRHLLIKLYTHIIDNQYTTNKVNVLDFFNTNIYTNRPTTRANYTDTFSMCVDHIRLSNPNNFVKCILIYHYNITRITKIYKQIDFLIDILEKILQNMKILGDITSKLDKKIREIEENKVAPLGLPPGLPLGPDNVKYKADKVRQSKEFIEQLRISYNNLFLRYKRAVGIKTTLAQKISKLREILGGDDVDQDFKTQINNKINAEAKLKAEMGKLSRTQSTSFGIIQFAKQGNARRSKILSDQSKEATMKSNDIIVAKKQQLAAISSADQKKLIEATIGKEEKKIASYKAKEADAIAKERTINSLIRHIQKLYLVVTTAYNDQSITDIEFLEIVINDFLKFMRKHIRAADNIKWFNDIKISITTLSKINKDIKSLRLDFVSLDLRFNGIFSDVDNFDPVEGSQTANNVLDSLKEANPEMNVCSSSSVCDNSIKCSACTNEQDCLSDNVDINLSEVSDNIIAEVANAESAEFQGQIKRTKSLERTASDNAATAIDILDKFVDVNLHDQYEVQPQHSRYGSLAQEFTFGPDLLNLPELQGMFVEEDIIPARTKRKADYDPTTGGNKKNIYKKNKPKTSPNTKPKTAPATKPKTAPTNKPKTSPNTKPKTAPATKPKTAPATEPKTAPTTKPKTAPATKPKTAPTTKPKTAPTTKPKTAPTTKPKTAPTTKPKTAPVTKPKTVPATKPKTSPTNKPK